MAEDWARGRTHVVGQYGAALQHVFTSDQVCCSKARLRDRGVARNVVPVFARRGLPPRCRQATFSTRTVISNRTDNRVQLQLPPLRPRLSPNPMFHASRLSPPGPQQKMGFSHCSLFIERQVWQLQIVSTEGFTPNDCAHFCAHASSKQGTIQAV